MGQNWLAGSPFRAAKASLAISLLLSSACSSGKPPLIAADLATVALRAYSVSTGLQVSWHAPADSSGVLVVQSAAPVTFDPAHGTAYAAGDVVGDGETVLYTGAESSATIGPAAAGQVFHVAAWAIDEKGQYGPVSHAKGMATTLGAQTGTVTIALNNTVTFSGPSDFGLSGSAVYTDAADTIVLSLAVTNNTMRLVMNPKVVVTSVNQGAASGTSFFPAGDKPMTYYGPNGLAVGEVESRDITITGVTGATDPIVLNVSVLDSPAVLSGNNTHFDTSGSGQGSGFGDYMYTAALDFAGTRFFYVDQKDDGASIISIADLDDYSVTTGPDLAAEDLEDSIRELVLSPDGSKLYAVYNRNAHWNGGADNDLAHSAVGDMKTTVEIVVLDPNTAGLTELARFTVIADDADRRIGADLAIADDGRRAVLALAAPTHSTLAVLDVLTGTVEKEIDVTGLGQHANFAAITPDGNTAYIAHGNYNEHVLGSNRIGVVDLSAETMETLRYDGGRPVSQMAWDPTGSRLLVTQSDDDGGEVDNAVQPPMFVVSGNVIENVDVSTQLGDDDINNAVWSRDGEYLYFYNAGSDAWVLDGATLAPVDPTDGDVSDIASLYTGDDSKKHAIVITH